MELRLTLKCLDTTPVLPINYQYELSAWIYGVLRKADAAYATFLHHRGYSAGQKLLELF